MGPPFPVAILAGGLATRLKPLTEKIPKSLVEVAGKPFLAHQLSWLHQQGIQRVVLCVGHLGDQIQAMFGDGAEYGVQIDYAYDGPRLLGTGGAIQQALPLLGEQFLVMYGDSYLPIPFTPVMEAFVASGRLGLMTVYANEGRYDTSNVWFDEGEIKVYDKSARLPHMRHIDFGLCAFRAAAFPDVGRVAPLDLAEVLKNLVIQRELAGFEVQERFYEIGSPAGLAELDRFLRESGTTGEKGA